MKSKKLTELQEGVLAVMNDPQSPVYMTAAEIARKMYDKGICVQPGQLAGPLGWLRARKELEARRMSPVPFKPERTDFVNPHSRYKEPFFVPMKQHYILPKNRKYSKPFKKIRYDCYRMFLRRLMALTHNQQQQALEGNWNV